MKRAAVVGFALVGSLLVLMAVPAEAAGTNLAVASQHTNATDFNDAEELTNVSVTGSANDAYVRYATLYNIVDDSGDSDVESNEPIAGDSVGDAPYTVEWQLVPNSDGTVTHINFTVSNVEGSDYGAVVDVYAIQEAPDGTYSEGTLIADDWDPDWATGVQSIALDTPFNVEDGETWTVEFVTQSSDNDGTLDTVEIGADDDSGLTGWHTKFGSTFNSGGNLTVHIRDGAPGTYISQNHTVGNASQGFTNLTLHNASATVEWQYNNSGNGWTTEATSTYTTDGNKTLDLSGAPDGETKWRVNVTFQNQTTNGVPGAQLYDEGLQFTNHAPDIDNSSATPTGDLSTAKPTLEIDANDSDFPLVQGETVDVEFFVDGSSVGTDTLSANGTASLALSNNLHGGDHSWSVWANDSYGGTQQSQTFNIKVPQNLTIREESPDHPIIDTASVSVTFYEQNDTDPTIVNRTVTDGKIDLSGLPVDSTFVVVLQTEGYYNRSIIIDSIFEQDTVFLINKTVSARQISFDIEDPTGEFTGQDTEIIIEHAINETLYATGNYTWLTVAGERQGAIETTTFWLAHEERYRIKVQSADETRILGAFTPEFNETVVLRPERSSINVTDEQGYAWNVSTDTVTADTIIFEFNDPDGSTTDLRLRIHESGNESNVIYDQTHPGPHGYLRVTQPLTSSQANQTWVVDWIATRNGETIGGEWTAGKQVQEQIVPLDDTWQEALAVLVVVLTGALFSVRNAEVGAVTTAFVGGGFWVAGWLPTAAGGAVMVALFGAVLWKVRQPGGV